MGKQINNDKYAKKTSPPRVRFNNIWKDVLMKQMSSK